MFGLHAARVMSKSTSSLQASTTATNTPASNRGRKFRHNPDELG